MCNGGVECCFFVLDNVNGYLLVRRFCWLGCYLGYVGWLDYWVRMLCGIKCGWWFICYIIGLLLGGDLNVCFVILFGIV